MTTFTWLSIFRVSILIPMYIIVAFSNGGQRREVDVGDLLEALGLMNNITPPYVLMLASAFQFSEFSGNMLS